MNPAMNRQSNHITAARLILFAQKPMASMHACDSNCPQWVSSKICAHSIATAEVNSSLSTFLDWYICYAHKPNITALGMSGMPTGRGKKKNQVTRRKANTYKSSPSTIIALPPTLASSSMASTSTEDTQTLILPSASTHSSVSTTITPQISSAYFHQSLPLEVMPINPTQLSFTSSSQAVSSAHVSQSYSPSMCTAVYQQPAASSVFYPHYNAIYPPSPVTWTSHSQTIAPRPPPNCNPFYLKFITGNIRMCQGCRHTLRLADGAVPPPPNDLTIARAEIRPYRDSSGNLITPRKESAVHYHCHIWCIKAVEPLFVPSALRIPVDIYNQLTPIHWEYLRGTFGL